MIDHPRLADPQIIESLFIFCVMWSLGATLIQQPETPVSVAGGLRQGGGIAGHRLEEISDVESFLSVRIRALTRNVQKFYPILLSHLPTALKDRDRFDTFIKSLANMGMVDGDRVAPTQLPAKSM